MKAFTKISAKDRHRKENFQGYLFITYSVDTIDQQKTAAYMSRN